MMGEDCLTGLALLHTTYNMPLDLGAIIADQHTTDDHAVITWWTSYKKVIFCLSLYFFHYSLLLERVCKMRACRAW